MNILQKISTLRELRNWTEYKLSEESGLPQSTISSWYRNNMLPSIPSLEKICQGFGITMSEFFANEGDPIFLTLQQKKFLEKLTSLNDKQRQALLDFLYTL